MNQKTLLALLAAVTLAAAVASLGWYDAAMTARSSRTQWVASSLGAVASLLKENQVLIRELGAEPFAEPGTAILPSYIDRIRRDGVAKHAAMKQRLDQLNENNTAIVALAGAYVAQAKTPGFVLEANKFRDYASAWRDRWDSVMDLFMAGGGYASSEVPFPQGFPAAVQAEIAAAR